MRGKKRNEFEERPQKAKKREREKVLGSSRNSKFKVKNQKSKVEKVKINLRKKSSFKKISQSLGRSLNMSMSKAPHRT